MTELIEPRRTTGGVRRTDVLAVVGAVAAAVGFSWLLFGFLAPFSGLLGFGLVAYLAFCCFYVALVALDESAPTVRDRIAGAIVHSLGFLMLAALVVVVVYTIVRGASALVHLNFFVEDLDLAGPLDPLTVGGLLHALIGTLEQIGIALAITIPLGVLGAVFLSEMPGPYSGFVRTVVEAMTALPSIVAGLFIYATVILGLGMDYCGFAASLAISVMMLPIVIRAADVVLRLVPGSLREASLALGSSQWRTVWHVVLPTARSGLTTAVILGTARGVGETSPVLLTAGYTTAVNTNPMANPQVSLPRLTFELVKNSEPTYVARGFGTAAVLLGLVLVLFVLARAVGGRSGQKGSS